MYNIKTSFFKLTVIALLVHFSFNALAQLQSAMQIVNPQFNLIDNTVTFDVEFKIDTIGFLNIVFKGYVSNAQLVDVEVYQQSGFLLSTHNNNLVADAAIFGLPGNYHYISGGVNAILLSQNQWTKIAEIRAKSVSDLKQNFCASIILDENSDGDSFTFPNGDGLTSFFNNFIVDDTIEINHYNWIEDYQTDGLQYGYSKEICVETCGSESSTFGDCYKENLQNYCGLNGTESFNNANVVINNSAMTFNQFINASDTVDINVISNFDTGNELGIRLGQISTASDTITDFIAEFLFNPPLKNFTGKIYDIDENDIIEINGYLNTTNQQINIFNKGDCLNTSANFVESICGIDFNGNNNPQKGSFEFEFTDSIDQLIISFNGSNFNTNNDFTFVLNNLSYQYNTIDTLIISTGYNRNLNKVYEQNDEPEGTSDLFWTITELPSNLNLEVPRSPFVIYPVSNLNWNLDNINSAYISLFESTDQIVANNAEPIVYKTCFGIIEDNSAINLDLDVLVDDYLILELSDFNENYFFDSLTTITSNVNSYPTNFSKSLILQKGSYCLKANFYNDNNEMAFNINGKIYGDGILSDQCFSQPFTCLPQININGTVAASNYKSSSIINSAGQIEDFKNVNFQTVDTILLQNDFEVSSNSNFYAYLDDCEESTILVENYCDLEAPTNLIILTVFEDSLLLTWDAVPNVAEYLIYYEANQVFNDNISTSDTFLIVTLNDTANHHLFYVNSNCINSTNNALGSTISYISDSTYNQNCLPPGNLMVEIINDSLSISFDLINTFSTYNVVIKADGFEVADFTASSNSFLFFPDDTINSIDPLNVLIYQVEVTNNCGGGTIIKILDGIFGIDDVPEGIENVDNQYLINICKFRNVQNIVFQTFINQIGNVALDRFTCRHAPERIYKNQQQYIECHCDPNLNRPLPIIKCNQ